MATAGAFERQLTVATAGLEPDAIGRLLAQTARAALADAIRSGEASERYTRSVNGRVGAAEETVVAPGPIVYRFHYLEEVALYALTFCTARSPEKSGRYRASWFAMVDGAVWDGISEIPADAELIITNDQPYHRKIDVGAMRLRVAPRIVESARQAVLRQFRGSVTAERRFIALDGIGTSGQTLPYILKGKGRRRRAAQTRRSSAYRAGREFLASRRDTAAGSEMTYPALVVRAR